MKAIGIWGSPRKNSNTEFMLNKALNLLESKGVDTELIPLRDYDIRPCDACYTCWKKESAFKRMACKESLKKWWKQMPFLLVPQCILDLPTPSCGPCSPELVSLQPRITLFTER